MSDLWNSIVHLIGNVSLPVFLSIVLAFLFLMVLRLKVESNNTAINKIVQYLGNVEIKQGTDSEHSTRKKSLTT